MKEVKFIINKFITLKLENNNTNIYVNGKKFLHCKYLLLNLIKINIPQFDEIDSIDEAIDLYNIKNRENRGNESNKIILGPETEFVGHCSNLQVWAENNYNLRVLHSSLSLPLLMELVKCGDTKAIVAVKEEILERLESKNEKIIQYFMNESFFDVFTSEELEMIFEEIPINNQELLKSVNKLINRKWILEKLKKRKHIVYNVECRTT